MTPTMINNKPRPKMPAGATSLSQPEERRQGERKPVKLQGRLGYGGPRPGLTQCEILDLSETGMRISTFAQIDSIPEYVSVEFSGLYMRARCCWTAGREAGLEFIFENTNT